MGAKSTKRTSSESCLIEKTIGFSDSLRQTDNVKRARYDPPSGTTLEDLPIELLEDILIKSVVMEVKEMKLAKWAWKEKYHADLVMSRLGTVSSQWSNILTTNYFRNQVYGQLGGTEQGTARLELLQESKIAVSPIALTTMKDAIFVLWSTVNHRFFVNVYDRNSLEKEKDVIPLPDINPLSLVASSVSNCLYLLNREQRLQGSVLRICRSDKTQFNISALISHVWRGDNHQFNISTVISDLWLPNPTLSVATNGEIILSKHLGFRPPVVKIYDATGSLQHEMKLSTGILSLSQIISKPNGNLVLVSGWYKTKLTEIDLQGNILRQYRMPVEDGYNGRLIVSQADTYGRIIATTEERWPRKVILLDPEFNQLDFSGMLLDEYTLSTPLFHLHFCSERNEIVRFYDSHDISKFILGDLIYFFRVVDE